MPPSVPAAAKIQSQRPLMLVVLRVLGKRSLLPLLAATRQARRASERDHYRHRTRWRHWSSQQPSHRLLNAESLEVEDPGALQDANCRPQKRAADLD